MRFAAKTEGKSHGDLTVTGALESADGRPSRAWTSLSLACIFRNRKSTDCSEEACSTCPPGTFILHRRQSHQASGKLQKPPIIACGGCCPKRNCGWC